MEGGGGGEGGRCIKCTFTSAGFNSSPQVNAEYTKLYEIKKKVYLAVKSQNNFITFMMQMLYQGNIFS